jgi:hypothetical protein
MRITSLLSAHNTRKTGLTAANILLALSAGYFFVRAFVPFLIEVAL